MNLPSNHPLHVGRCVLDTISVSDFIVTHPSLMCKMFYIDISQKGAMRMWIFCRYITKNGVRIYPKNKNFFRFWVDDEKADDKNADSKK